jgi:hypothetical protein
MYHFHVSGGIGRDNRKAISFLFAMVMAEIHKKPFEFFGELRC